jgi:hypothetical protein
VSRKKNSEKSFSVLVAITHSHLVPGNQNEHGTGNVSFRHFRRKKTIHEGGNSGRIDTAGQWRGLGEQGRGTGKNHRHERRGYHPVTLRNLARDGSRNLTMLGAR